MKMETKITVPPELDGVVVDSLVAKLNVAMKLKQPVISFKREFSTISNNAAAIGALSRNTARMNTFATNLNKPLTAGMASNTNSMQRILTKSLNKMKRLV